LFIINNFLPFQTVSSDEFKDLLNIIIPNYQPPTRQRIANELLDSTVCCLFMFIYTNFHFFILICS
uniref:Ovule protein n=1 Tax=Heterorhabditis bacteriophora TaxID=37862 RepID=A0A1I7WA86_HETBA